MVPTNARAWVIHLILHNWCFLPLAAPRFEKLRQIIIKFVFSPFLSLFSGITQNQCGGLTISCKERGTGTRDGCIYQCTTEDCIGVFGWITGNRTYTWISCNSGWIGKDYRGISCDSGWIGEDHRGVRLRQWSDWRGLSGSQL